MKHKTKAEKRDFSMVNVLKSSTKFVLLFKKTFLAWCLCNFLFLLIFSFIPNGWTNSLSIIWLVCYYVFWCVYIRHIQQHPPYFSLIRIFNGLIPASKIMFFNIAIYFIILAVPFIPLFMGFREKYLKFFEIYMGILQSHSSLTGKTLFYLFMLSIAPFTIIRPYLAWISSLIGKSRSISDAYKKTKGNYLNFVYLAFILSAFFMIFYYIDTIYGINTMIYIGAILPIYFNIVFINIYKVFYKRKSSVR